MSFFASRLRESLSIRAALVTGALLLGLLAAAPAAGARTAPAATRTVRCSISKVWHSLGPTYVESILVRGVNCASAEKLVRDYNTCRLKAGGVKGHCTAEVDGFRFKELRTRSPVQFEAQVTATRGRESVVFTYSQDI